MVISYPQPKTFPRSETYTLKVNGAAVDVLTSDLAHFAICTVTEGAVEVELSTQYALLPGCTLHPLRLGLCPSIEANHTLRFSMPQADNVLIQTDGLPAMYLFIHGQAESPDSGTGGTLRIPAGQIVEAGMLDLEGYDSLHLEGGAVLRGRILARNKPGLRITGHGIFDGSYYLRERDGCIPSIVLDRCHHCVVEDITMINPAGWMLLLGACHGAHVNRLKQLGRVVSSDGIDVVGSSDVLIENGFLSNNDDCIVVKAFEVGANNLDATYVDGRQNVKNIVARNCVCINGPAGNALEIGHELSVDSVRNIRFENIDVVSVHGQGAVFSIHNNDRARVENVLFENITIEHCYDKLIDFRISRSRFSTDDSRGHIKDIRLRNITWHKQDYNEGYTVSIIGGWDDKHRIEDVMIENFHISGEPLTDTDRLDIYSRYAFAGYLEGVAQGLVFVRPMADETGLETDLDPFPADGFPQVIGQRLIAAIGEKYRLRLVMRLAGLDRTQVIVKAASVFLPVEKGEVIKQDKSRSVMVISPHHGMLNRRIPFARRHGHELFDRRHAKLVR